MKNKDTIQTLSDLKKDFEKLRSQMTPEVVLFSSLLFQLFEVVLLTMSKKTTSRNSNLAPSQDPFRAKLPKGKNGKKPGGQKGHVGASLVFSPNPDETIIIPAGPCANCLDTLVDIPVESISKHQVIDIKFKKHIVEYHCEHKGCNCGHHQCSSIAGAPVQYGNSLKATAIELNQIQCIPIERCAKFFQQKFDITLSSGTIVNFARKANERLLIWEESAKDDLVSSEQLNADETGINIDGKNFWCHVVSNEKTTLIIPHEKRGIEAVIDNGILANFHGQLVHDFWAPYGQLDVIHGACHPHLKREFTKIHEKFGQKWALELSNLLEDANLKRDQAEGCLSIEQMNYYENEYTRLIKKGEKLNPKIEIRENKKGRIAQTYPRQVLNRLIMYRDWVLIFLYIPTIPYSNNQAERDFRMLKVQQKVSGYFKTMEGARTHCRILSYVSTMGKRGYTKHQALTILFEGT